MILEDLFLKKEELPIVGEIGFQIPIHPKLLEPHISLDPKLANKIFPEVAKDWHNDLQVYYNGLEESQTKEWIYNVFLKKGVIITKEVGHQYLPGGWKDDALTNEKGFAIGFSISRNGGGGLYFNNKDNNCEAAFIEKYIKFSEEKLKEFEVQKESKKIIYAYAHHNIDHYPGALFLRNWAIRYMNEAFKELFN